MEKEKKGKRFKPIPGWNGFIKWLPLTSRMIISCCDCGLAHVLEFKKIGKKLMWRGKRDKLQTKINRKLPKDIIIP